MINVYEKFTITNMHFLYLYLLNSQEIYIWWLKWKVCLLQHMFVCKWQWNASSWKCMCSNLVIATSLLRERMYSLMVSLLICWSDAQDGGARISINIQFPHCFVTPFYWIWPFRFWIYSARISEVWRKKVAEMNQICLSLQRWIRFVWA